MKDYLWLLFSAETVICRYFSDFRHIRWFFSVCGWCTHTHTLRQLLYNKAVNSAISMCQYWSAWLLNNLFFSFLNQQRLFISDVSPTEPFSFFFLVYIYWIVQSHELSTPRFPATAGGCFSPKKALINPLCTTCPAPDGRQTDRVVERLAAKKPDIFLRSRRRPKQS